MLLILKPLLFTAILLSLAGLATLLCGCGNGGGGSDNHQQKTTVIVMRHCLRSTPSNDVLANTSFIYHNNYSAKEWPNFSVPDYYCLPRGEQLIEAQGQWVKSLGGLPLPLRAIADNVPEGQRDNVTMQRFLKGLSIPADNVTSQVNGSCFQPVNTSACNQAKPSDQEMLAELNIALEHPTLPADYEKEMQSLYKAIQVGAAGNWTGIPCTGGIYYEKGVAYPMPIGACQAAATFAERLLMEWGGGMDIGWGRVAAYAVPALMRLHSFHFYQWFALRSFANWYGASILRNVASRLDSAEAGTTLFVGHDSDIMMLNTILGLSWDATPFPINATLPGSMLRFDREGDTITASYMYVANFSHTDGVMLSVPAQFGGDSSQISMDSFSKLVEEGTIEQCASTGSTATGAVPNEAVEEETTIV